MGELSRQSSPDEVGGRAYTMTGAMVTARVTPGDPLARIEVLDLAEGDVIELLLNPGHVEQLHNALGRVLEAMGYG